MLSVIYGNFPDVLCALLLIARIGDLATTYLATPNLLLEANPLARKFGWPFGLLTIAACLLPYYDVGAGVVALIVFLFVCASNAGKVFLVRAVGEKEYFAFLIGAAKKGKLVHALAGVAASSGFIALVAATIFLLYPSSEEWGFFIGLSVLFYAVAIWLHRSLFAIRLFRQAAAELKQVP